MSITRTINPKYKKNKRLFSENPIVLDSRLHGYRARRRNCILLNLVSLPKNHPTFSSLSSQFRSPDQPMPSATARCSNQWGQYRLKFSFFRRLNDRSVPKVEVKEFILSVSCWPFSAPELWTLSVR